MTTAVQHRRGTTAEHSTFTGLEGEVTIDTTKDTAVIHDGALAGGYPLAKETLSNANPSGLGALTGASTASDDQFVIYDTSVSQLKKISRAELNNAITAEPFDTVDINGGTIDGTVIGGSSAAAGTFTSVNSTTAVSSTSLTTPLVIGGTTTTSALSLRSTSGVGTTGADIIFQTGNNGATEAMRVLNSGFVGIGTASPTTRLDVAGGDLQLRTNATYLRSVTAGGTSIRMLGLNSSDIAYIGPIDVGPAAAYHSVASSVTLQSFFTGGSERMRIDSSGNVGIGTASPTAKLDVRGSMYVIGAAGTRVTDTNTGNGFEVVPSTTNNVLSYNRTTAAYLPIRWRAGIQSWEVDNTERVRIDSNGTLVVGVTTPLANTRVHISQNSDSNFSSAYSPGINKQQLVLRDLSDTTTYPNCYTQVSFVAGATGAGASYIAGAREGAGTSFMAFGTGTSSGATERMRITSAGDVGIGTNTPVNKLQINGSLGRNAPVTKTGNFTLADTENWLICNGAGTITVTLPAASSWTGREVMIKTISAQTVVSASSNVVPLAGGAAGTAILAATAGKFATLVSDGTNWIIMQGN